MACIMEQDHVDEVSTTVTQQPLDPDRTNCLTGSEIASILGENPFPDQSPCDAMFKKKFNVHFPENVHTRHGHKYEPVALSCFLAKTHATLETSSYERSAKYGWISGTVDALVTMPDGRRVIVEIKCPLTRKIPKDGVQKYPQYYYAQMQTYMEITGRSVCMFVQYKPSMPTPKGRKINPEVLDICEVRRDRVYMYERMPYLKRFWDTLYTWRASVERYQLKASLHIIIEAYRNFHRKIPNNTTRMHDMAASHFLCRLKATYVRMTTVPPYQTPDELANDPDDPREPPVINIIPTIYCMCSSCQKDRRMKQFFVRKPQRPLY